MTPTGNPLSEGEREELRALALINDATGKPSFIARRHWHETGYCRLVRRGLVKWGEPPAGFDRKRFAGTTITPAGRAALSTLGERTNTRDGNE